MEYWRLLAHNHWITLNIFGRKLRVCARCSGYILGFSLPFLFFKSLNIRFSLISNEWLLVCFLLAIPITLDWVTQSFGLRNSSNSVRMFTGILLGFNLYIYTLLNINMEMKKILFVTITLVIFIIGNLGKFKFKAKLF
jgi:uncharacterized membrane protein